MQFCGPTLFSYEGKNRNYYAHFDAKRFLTSRKRASGSNNAKKAPQNGGAFNLCHP
ncbi:MAG: hypothetical protein WCU80_10815 [Paludibacteraceae bacterium]